MTLVTRHLLCPVGGKLGQVLVRAPAAAGSPSFFSSLSCVSVPPPLCAVSIPRTSAEKLVEANRPPRPVRGEDRRRLSGRRRQVEKSADASRALQLPCGAAAARSSSPPKLLPSLASASPFSRYLASAPRAAPLLQSPVLSSSSLSHDRPFSMSIASSPALASPLCRPRFFSLTVQVSSEKGGGREGSEDEGTTSEQPSGGRDSFEREGVLAKAGRLLHRAVPAAWKALERRQLEMLLPKYIFDDSLSEDPLLGMRIMEFRDTPREALQAHRDEIDARLKAFAGDIDPFAFVRDDVESLDLSLLSSVRSVYPEVSPVARYLLTAPGKRFRPVLLLILRQALLSLNVTSRSEPGDESASLRSRSLSPSGSASPLLSCGAAFSAKSQTRRKDGLELCMVHVAELIHTASLMHDDVIDGADTRRGQPATHRRFCNKTAILGGDFLLSRGNGIVAMCGSTEVMMRMSSVIESLVKGELIQALSDSRGDLESALRTYLTKTYHKTASLIAESCACLAILMGLPSRWVTWSADFGACVGMAFQLYDDELDFTASSENLGKPALNDLRSGLVTAPLLMAALEEEARGASAGGEARTILERRADREGDVEKAIKLIFASDAMPRSQLMGRLYVRRATELLEELTAEIGTSSLGGSDGDAAKKAAIPDACRALAALLQATLQRRSG
ncbi:polyprenyl synthetase superfamily protein [Toxoplasma gondii GT1]|uniref:Polyprenyl synthetase superfamily protein n=5 Tax=Toxoplasma gondii TaxID=5811 RepID=S7WDN0_TOXGG|nr:polyprenyl synthetase superfamily protein [Toxoplasma gondii GT1]KAF4642365.1 polyprenyl synthetase superfamily protein [Toxoplasma gondii]